MFIYTVFNTVKIYTFWITSDLNVRLILIASDKAGLRLMYLGMYVHTDINLLVDHVVVSEIMKMTK